MEIKKAAHADLEKGKGLNLLLGIVVALSVLFAAFQWRSFAEVTEHQYALNQADLEDTMLIEDLPEDKPEEPEPVAQQEQQIEAILPQEFNVVDNDVKVQDIVFRSSDETDQPLPPPAPVAPAPVEEETEEIFEVVEESAEFVDGGMEGLNKYLAKNIRYPEVAQEAGIQGRVVVQFVVEKDGSATDIKVVRSVDPALDKEAERVVKSMPKWKPGKQRGKPVRSKFTLPVQFRLQ